MKKAFTLAEVLITLGIIGVVAALVLSSFINNYQKKITATKVKEFYSTMSRTFELAQSDYGEFSNWIFDDETFGALRDGEAASYEDNVKFIKRYIFPYLKTAKPGVTEPVEVWQQNNKAKVRLLDGGAFTFNYQKDAVSWGKMGKLGMVTYFIDGDVSNRTPRNMFTFMLTEEKGLKPFDLLWDNNVSTLMNNTAWGCKSGTYAGLKNGNYCTKLLELNGWNIPKDYPW